MVRCNRLIDLLDQGTSKYRDRGIEIANSCSLRGLSMPKAKKAKKEASEERILESLPRSVEQKAAGSFKYIIGVDEAGRGPLAGPVVAAACMIENGISIEGIIDSKQTKEEDREKTFEVLVHHPSVKYGVSVVSHTEIDEVNILQATMNAMKRATDELLSKISKSKSKIDPEDIIALIDGNRVPLDMPVESKYVIKGDGSIFSIAAASIIAKVTRDRIMVELDKKYPHYNLAQHKGYPTFEHRSLLMKHGPSDIHRTSYGPVKQAMLAHGIPVPEKKQDVVTEDSKTNSKGAQQTKAKKGKVTKGVEKPIEQSKKDPKENNASPQVKVSRKRKEVASSIPEEEVKPVRKTRRST